MIPHDMHDLLASIESHTTAMTIDEVAALFPCGQK
jgi:hypothetical protein